MYAKLTDPLVKLTSPKVNFKWTPEHQQAFEQLQKTFFNRPFIIQPNFKEKFYLNTDASSYAISAILMQKHGEDLLPISYFSKALQPSEKKYPAIKLELMAIYKGVLAFKYYLCGRPFIIVSDSKPLKHYSKVTSPMDITSRWLLTLGEYDFTFVHLPGKQNVLADYFSRTPFPDSETISNNPVLLTSSEVLPITSEENINHILNSNDNPKPGNLNKFEELLNSVKNSPKDPLLEITINTILREQLNDPNLSKFYQNILNNVNHSDSAHFKICPETKLLPSKTAKKDDRDALRIAMPNTLRVKALTIAHVPHYGINKTYETVSQKYYWKNIYQDTENFVLSCTRCITAKHHRIPQAPLQDNPIPSHPNEFISMDLVGPFENNYHILTIIDRFSRYLQLYPLKVISSQNVINSLFKYITTHGRPSVIHTDLGKQFTSQIFRDFTAKFGIRLIHSTSSHPQSNAISERINQSIKATILALQEDNYNFHNAIDIHQMMYNSSIHSSTKFSPNNIHFGRDISTLYDTYLPIKPFLATDNNRTFFSIMQDLDKIYQAVYNNLQLAQHLQNSKQHVKAKLRNINVGDIVYIKSSHAFRPKFSGPFKVVEKPGPVNVILQRNESPNSRRFRIHIDRLWISPPRRQHLIKDATVAGSEPSPIIPQANIQDSTIAENVHDETLAPSMSPIPSPMPSPNNADFPPVNTPPPPVLSAYSPNLNKSNTSQQNSNNNVTSDCATPIVKPVSTANKTIKRQKKKVDTLPVLNNSSSFSASSRYALRSRS